MECMFPAVYSTWTITECMFTVVYGQEVYSTRTIAEYMFTAVNGGLLHTDYSGRFDYNTGMCSV